MNHIFKVVSRALPQGEHFHQKIVLGLDSAGPEPIIGVQENSAERLPVMIAMKSDMNCAQKDFLNMIYSGSFPISSQFLVMSKKKLDNISCFCYFGCLLR